MLASRREAKAFHQPTNGFDPFGINRTTRIAIGSTLSNAAIEVHSDHSCLLQIRTPSETNSLPETGVQKHTCYSKWSTSA